MLIIDSMAELEWIKSKRTTFTSRSNNHWWIGLEQNHSASDYAHPRGGWYWVDGNKLANSGQVSETTISATTTLNAYEELSYTTSYTITQDNVDKALLSNIVSVTANYFSNTVTDTSDSRACGSSDNVTSYWASSQPTNSSSSNYGVLQRSDGKLVSYDYSNNYNHILEITSAVSTPTGYTYVGAYGTSSYFLSSLQTNWYYSRTKAEAAGGNLVVINSTNEHNYLISIKDNLTLSSPYDKSWVGLYQDVNSCDYAEPSGGWFWIDTDDNKDSTNTNLNQNPLLEVTKTATVTDSNSNGLNDAGDIIVYTITLENKGNVTLSSPTFNEYLIDGEGTNITSALVGPTYNSKTFSPTIIEIPVTVAVGSGGGNKFFVSGIETKDIVFRSGYVYRFDQSNSSNSGHPFNFSTTNDGTHNGGSAYSTNVTITGTPGSSGAYTEIAVSDSTPLLYYYCSNHSLMGGAALKLAGLPLVQGTIRPNETETYTATYTISSDAGSTAFISNTVSVTASTFGQTNNVSDTSDDGDDTDGDTTGDETRVDLSPIASFEVTKTGTQTADNGDGIFGPGDTITYTMVVSNTGNLKVTNITLADTMVDGYGNAQTLASGPTFVSASLGSASGTIEISEVASYTSTYIVNQISSNSGLVSNSLYVTGSTYGFSNNVTDTSDDLYDASGNSDDPTVILIPEILDLEVTKTAVVNDLDKDGQNNLGDQIQYTFSINNKGNTSLNTLTFVDNLLGFNGSNIPNTILSVPESTNLFLRSNAMDDQDSYWDDDGSQASGNRNCGEPECLSIPKSVPYYYGTPSGSTYDSNLAQVLPINGFGTTTPTGDATASNGMRGSRLWSTSNNSFIYQDITFDANTSYTISVYAKAVTGPFSDPMNFVVWDGTGSFDVSQVAGSYKSEDYFLTSEWKRYTYTFTTDSGGPGRAGFHPPVQGQNNIFWGAQLEKLDKATPYIHTYNSSPLRNATQLHDHVQVINTGETITLDGYFNINQEAVNSGGVSNTLIVSAISATSSSVSDTSDDGIDNDGNTVDDPTFTSIVSTPAIEVTKTAVVADSNTNSRTDIGDIVTYTITVSNTGNTSISGISFNDVITTSLGVQLSLNAAPTRISTSNGSAVGSLKVGEYATYVALFTINATAFAAEKISNTVTVTANAGGLTGNVSDTSDDGDDSDGNTTDDPTETVMEPTPSIEVTKTAVYNDDNGNGANDVGDSIKFIINIENTGNTALSSLTFVDTLVDKNDSALSLTNGPYFVSSTLSSTIGNLKLQESAVYHAFFTINSQALSAGSVKNSVLATASSPGQTNNVTDTSDDGDDSDGNTTNDVTEVQITAGGTVNVTKVSSVFDNGDSITGAGDTINYVIKVTNTGTTSLTSITVSDTLTDNNGNPLTLSNGPNFVSASQGSSAGTLQPNEIATYSAAYVIQQSAAETGGIKNSVTVTGSSPGNSNDVSDVSDDADDTDGNTVDDQTIVAVSLLPVLEVTKTSTITDNGDGITGLGDIIVYSITAQNKGNVLLTGVTISDTPTDGNGNPLTLSSGPTFVSSSASSAQGTLTVNETATYSATIVINQAAIDSGDISNTVTATASSPGNSNDVSETSDDGDDTDGNTSNDPTVVTITSSPSIEVTKTSSITDNGDGVTGLGDTITYTITAQNKGNVTLSGVTLTDTLTDGNGGALSLTSGPTFTSSSASSAQGTLTVNETATYTATYTINQAGVDSGSVLNSVLATASSPGQSNNVTDTSDDGDDSDGNTTNDATVVSITASPLIEVTKTSTITDNGNGVVGVGDIINYTITVENKGNVTLTGLTFSDILKDLNGSALSISSGPFFSGANQGSAQGTIKVGETATFIAFYIIQQAAVDAGGVSNSGSATASSPGQSNNVTDTSDDGDDTDGNTLNDPTVTTITGSPSLEVTKTAAVTDNGNGKTGVSDVINYTVTVKNTGDVSLTGLTLVDTLTDGNGGTLSLNGNLGFSSSTQGSSPGSLKVNETATYSGYYIISSAAALTSSINNSVLATASSPGQSNNVTDTSDDGDDTDGNTVNDQTQTLISPSPLIEATKTASVTDVNSNGITDTGDIITYTITAENKGNIVLTGVTLTDVLTDNDGNVLTMTNGPTFNSASASSAQGTLTTGETASYTATYTISSGAAYSTKVKNTVTITGSSPGNTDDVSDISDDGVDNDGNTINDSTDVQTVALASLEVTKTATVTDNGNGTTGNGDTIVYTITVKNDGGVTLTGITLTDTLTDGNGGSLTLNGGPTFVSSSASSAAGTLVVNETATYTASYTINQAASYTSKISNSVLVAGGTPGNTGNVTDTSDDGDDSDGNTTDDATEIAIDPLPLIEVTKTASITDEGDGIISAGDVINYVISIENKGNVTLTGLTVADVITDGNGSLLTMNTGPYFSGSNQGSGLGTLLAGETATYRAYYIIESSILNTGSISNAASATASSPGNSNDVSDVSDDGDDTDGNTINDPTITNITLHRSLR
jgi:uncharacterized repeat protein (TIGR01451 family)